MTEWEGGNYQLWRCKYRLDAFKCSELVEKCWLANGQQAASTINLKNSYHACKQIIVFKNNINRLLFIINIVTFNCRKCCYGSNFLSRWHQRSACGKSWNSGMIDEFLTRNYQLGGHSSGFSPVVYVVNTTLSRPCPSTTGSSDREEECVQLEIEACRKILLRIKTQSKFIHLH